MKKTHLLSAILFSMIGGLIITTTSCGNETIEPQPDTKPTTKYSYLELDTTNFKNEYIVGEKLDLSGLVVKSITVNGQDKTSETLTSDKYTVSFDINKKLELSDAGEIIVMSNDENVRSTSFSITVKLPAPKKGLHTMIQDLIDKGNYEVKTYIGANQITGLVTKNGVVWSSNVEDYYFDNGIGYSTYQGDTFSFTYDDKKINEGKFVIDNYGIDYGLFDRRTIANSFGETISNYSINSITDAELEYLKTVKLDDQNRYVFDARNSKWLFNLIGHKDAAYNPLATFTNKQDMAKGDYGTITISQEDGCLVIETTPSKNSGIKSQASYTVIKNIGTTKLSSLDEFLKNPKFAPSLVDRQLIAVSKLLKSKNYEVRSSAGTGYGLFSEDYSYVDGFLRDGKNPSSIYLHEGHKVTRKNYKGEDELLEAGNYRLKVDGFNFDIVKDFTMSYDSTGYLDSFDFLANPTKYFTKTSENNYVFTITSDTGFASEHFYLAETYLNADPEALYDRFELNLHYSADAIDEIKIKVFTKQGILGTVTANNFGKVKVEPVEEYIKTLY